MFFLLKVYIPRVYVWKLCFQKVWFPPKFTHIPRVHFSDLARCISPILEFAFLKSMRQLIRVTIRPHQPTNLHLYIYLPTYLSIFPRSTPRSLWPLKHLMRRHDLTKVYFLKYVLITRWRQLHCLQIYTPGGTTCNIKLPQIDFFSW